MFTVIGTILVLSLRFGEGTVIVDELKANADKVNSIGTTWTAETEELTHQMEYSSTDTAEKRSDENGSRNTEEVLSTRGCMGNCGFNEEEYTEFIDDYGSAESDVALPPIFDARKKWEYCPSIGKIYNQGNCSSSWAVGVVSAFTDRICIKSNGEITAPRSSHQVMSCCKRCGSSCTTSASTLREAWFYLRNEGAVTGGDYNSDQMNSCQPYKMKPCAVANCVQLSNQRLPLCSTLVFTEPQCQTSCDSNGIKFKKDKIKVNEVKRLMNARAVKLQVMKYGPVSLEIALYENFYSYKSGVYKGVSGQKIGHHVVRVIGWGITKDYYKYWLITGSFGTGWGKNGIGKIDRNDDDLAYAGNFYSGTVIV